MDLVLLPDEVAYINSAKTKLCREFKWLLDHYKATPEDYSAYDHLKIMLVEIQNEMVDAENYSKTLDQQIDEHLEHGADAMQSYEDHEDDRFYEDY